jgi:hypothetical protein
MPFGITNISIEFGGVWCIARANSMRLQVGEASLRSNVNAPATILHLRTFAMAEISLREERSAMGNPPYRYLIKGEMLI